MNSGKLALPRKRHDDRLVVSHRAGLLPALGEPLVRGVKTELPASVQIRPVLAHRIRPGMLRPRDAGFLGADVSVQEEHKKPKSCRFDPIMIGDSQSTSQARPRGEPSQPHAPRMVGKRD